MLRARSAIPSQSPYPLPGDVMPGDYRAIGTEPFWDLTIGRDLVFTDRGNNISVAEPTPIVRRGPDWRDFYPGRRLRVTIDRRPCSDGMSERRYPDTVNVIVDGRAYRGCGAEAAFFARVGEDGRDKPIGEHDLSNTNWRVTAINGRPVPVSGYYFNFDRDRVSGRLGCNAIGGNYRVTGSTLTTPALTMTRMACPAMQDEDAGHADHGPADDARGERRPADAEQPAGRDRADSRALRS